jgi:1-acyl-sn-glycerol-3-phosphate acyltransferase
MSHLPDTRAVPAGPPVNLFRNRNFLLLWAAYGVSACGDHVSEMAVLRALGASEAPNLTQLTALMTFMFMLPFFVLGPVTGVLADRLPRRGLMIFADIIRAGIMFNFAWLVAKFAGGSPWQQFVPLLLIGVFAAVFSPARSAFLPTLIRDDQLVRANAMSSGLGVIATMISAVIGGYLATHYAPSVSFHLTGVTFLISAMLLVLITRPRAEIERVRERTGTGGISEAVRYIFQHKRVLQLIGVAVVVWLCGAVVRSTIPTLVRDIYLEPGDPSLFSEMSLFLARLGLGMLTGAIILTVLGDSLRSEMAITWSLMGIAGAFAIVSITALVDMSRFWSYHLGGLAIILSGIFAAGVMASYNALLQRILPNRIRGRIFGLADVALMAGLLLSTGLLGIPGWERLDRWAGWILVGVTLVTFGTGLASLVVRLKASPFGAGLRFWKNLNDFYCHWWFRLKREGLCTIPGQGPVIVVANHTCSIDPILIIASCPNRVVSFMVAHEYANIPIARHLLRVTECIPVKRDRIDATALKTAIRHLNAGKVLGIFIEGRIAPPGEEVEPKDGAALLAIKTGAKIVPVHVSGTVYDDNIAKSFFRRVHARVRYGKPIDLSSYGDRPDKETLAAISQMLMEKIRELAPGRQPEQLMAPAAC